MCCMYSCTLELRDRMHRPVTVVYTQLEFLVLPSSQKLENIGARLTEAQQLLYIQPFTQVYS